MMNKSDANQRLWHHSNAPACMGCTLCPSKKVCGGLQVDSAIYDCTDLCKCKDPLFCRLVCPRNPKNFVARTREIGDFPLDDIPLAPVTKHRRLPSVIPIIYSRSKRVGRLHAPAAAVRFQDLFSARTGSSRFSNRAAICRRFGLASDSRIVVTGTGFEQPLEHYWSRARAAEFARELALLGPDLVTSPNFSLFSDVTRFDNMYNMKRIAICWYELASAQVPTALHVNARTDQDWTRWIKFLRFHEEIRAVAFEFGTGPASPRRGPWYAAMLARLANSVGRPLSLFVRGGRRYLAQLQQAFGSLIYLSPTPFMKTLKRRKLQWKPGSKETWARHLTVEGTPLDDLLQHNVNAYTQC